MRHQLLTGCNHRRTDFPSHRNTVYSSGCHGSHHISIDFFPFPAKAVALVKVLAYGADVILTTGGVSVGVKDLLPEIMKKLGADILFHGIDLKPGMPTMASLYAGKPVISLSGNPFSASAVFELLMQPLLQKMTGSQQTSLVKKEADIAYDYPGNKGSRRVLKAYDDGHAVHITKGQHNAQMRQGIGTNCLVDMPAGTGPLKAGDKVHIWRL